MNKLEQLKREVIEILKKQDKKVQKKDVNEDISKSLLFTSQEIIQKAAYPVGTVREWKGKKFKKIAPGQWKRMYEGTGRGTNIAVGKLIAQVKRIDNVEDLMKFCMLHKQRFANTDVLEKIRQAVDEHKNNLSDGKTEENKGKQGKISPKSETINSIGKKKKEISEGIDDYYKKMLKDAKWVAESSTKRLGEKKLKALADRTIVPDDEWKNTLLNKVMEMIKEKPEDEEKIKDSLKTAIWHHANRVLETKLAQEKLESMGKNQTEEDLPIKDSDMAEARSVIGGDVSKILDGRDVYGNAKQTLVDKIKRRFRNNPAVCRAMLVYIKQEQERTGKTVFTPRHTIWELLPKLNENARETQSKGESETPTGTTGTLYQSKDGGISVTEDKDWGRYKISFPGKPDAETISTLKRNGFRWSPSTKTWVGYNTANGERSLKNVAEKIGLEKVGGDKVEKSYGIYITKEKYQEFVEKGFGKKDLSKLQKKQITDKNGHTRNVWVKVGEEQKTKRTKKQEEVSTPTKKAKVPDETSSFATDVSRMVKLKQTDYKEFAIQLEKLHSKYPINKWKDLYNKVQEKEKKANETIKKPTTSGSKYSEGSTISFEYGGNTLEGNIVAVGKDGVTVSNDKGGTYKVRYENINPESFNASDYRNKYQDSKIAELEKANKGEGVKYFLEKYLPGEEGKEMAKKAAETEKRVTKQVGEEGETIDRYRISGEGVSAVYSKERQKLHEKIFDYYFSEEKIKNATPKNGEKPKLVMLGGRAGAGKSWFTSDDGLYNKDEFVVLDADAIKTGVYDEDGKELCPPLPEYEGWNAQTVHEESSDLNKMLIAEAKRLGVNIIIDGTMNSVEKSVKQIQDFKDAGYFTSCDYMFTPMQESMKRACGRFKTKKGDYSGRFVPLGIMTDMTKNEDAFEAVKDIVDRYSFRDNYHQTNGKATLVCQKGEY